jgi:hypothetical protein
VEIAATSGVARNSERRGGGRHHRPDLPYSRAAPARKPVRPTLSGFQLHHPWIKALNENLHLIGVTNGTSVPIFSSMGAKQVRARPFAKRSSRR